MPLTSYPRFGQFGLVAACAAAALAVLAACSSNTGAGGSAAAAGGSVGGAETSGAGGFANSAGAAVTAGAAGVAMAGFGNVSAGGAEPTGGAFGAGGGVASGGIAGGGGANEAGAPSAGSASAGAAGSAGAGGTSSAPANLFAVSPDTVEVWVNGKRIGKSASPGQLLAGVATFVPGQENIIAIRATQGAAAKPYVQAELDGVFGKAGTSTSWKAKAAASADETSGDAWAAVAYDDTAWSAAADVGVAPSAAELATGPAQGIWNAGAAATALLRMRFYFPANWSAATPMGLGAAVTGGKGGQVVTVTTPSALAAAVSSSAAMVIQVSGTLDFSTLDGTTSASVCYQSQCSNGQYEYISNALGACDSSGAATFNYTYQKAGITPLLVASNKTIIGLGANATIKGKGFKLASGVSNVIIRNLTLTGLNPELIWGGDAIDLSGASKVWIDHNRISLIGRQFLVSHYDPNTDITVSFNDFDGNTKYSATCNGAHYWDMLLLGSGDAMTIANNWLRQMSGRSPHVGGQATSNVKLHLVNDYHDTIPGHACDPGSGGFAFYEGSYFKNVTTPFTTNADGSAYAPLDSTLSSTSSACGASLGRACVANFANSGTASFRLNAPALTAFSTLAPRLSTPYPAAEVPNCVPHLAGPGHI